MKHTKQWSGVLTVMMVLLSPFGSVLSQDDYPEFPFSPPSSRRYYLSSVFEKMGNAKDGETIPLLTLGPGNPDLTIGIALEDVAVDKGDDQKFTAEVALRRASAMMDNEFKAKVPDEIRVAEVHGRNFLGQDVYIIEYGFTKRRAVNGAGYPPTLFIPIFQHKKTMLRFLPNGNSQKLSAKKKGK